MSKAAKLIDIVAEVRGETELSFRLHDGRVTDWVPKSLVENNKDGSFTMPEWLAEDRGFM